MPSKFEPDAKVRVISMMREHLLELGSIASTCYLVGPLAGICGETLRGWVR